MNIVEAFAGWMEDESIATLGQDMFISRARTSTTVPDAIYWLTAAGGSSGDRNVNGGRQTTSTVNVFYRNTNPKTVYDNLATLADLVNGAECPSLSGFDVVQVETTGPYTDEDLDDENRTVGLLVVTITIYKE